MSKSELEEIYKECTATNYDDNMMREALQSLETLQHSQLATQTAYREERMWLSIICSRLKYELNTFTIPGTDIVELSEESADFIIDTARRVDELYGPSALTLVLFPEFEEQL